jgi:type IV secretory pathway VirJ component
MFIEQLPFKEYRRKPFLFAILGLLLLGLSGLLYISGRTDAVEIASIEAGRLGDARLYRSKAPYAAFVFVFSDSAGWTPDLEGVARELAARNVLVLGIDLPKYLDSLRASDDGCHYLISEIEDLSKRLQRQLRFPAYRSPILAGVGEGATLAYAALAQSPSATVAGAVSVDPVRVLHTKVRLCEGAPAKPAGEAGFTYDGRQNLPGWWLVEASEPAPGWLEKVIETTSAKRLELDSTTAATGRLRLALLSVVDETAENREVTRLPIVEIPAKRLGEMTAIIYSGDGGWRDLDKQIGEVLAEQDVSVIGVDSLRYFWKEKTPEETARDLGLLLRHAGEKWKSKKVILIGYSFGAGILPFTVNRLPAAERERIVLISLLGLEPRAPFVIALSAWLGKETDESAPAVLPELLQLDLAKVQCFYGEQEEDSLCRTPQVVGWEVIRTTGGHHFDGDYRALAMRILQGTERRIPTP